MLFDFAERKGEALVQKVRDYIRKGEAEKQDKQKKEDFFRELKEARQDLQAARSNYDFATEPALLEYYIYEIKAAETRLNYYMRLAKEEKLSNEGYLSGLFIHPQKRGEEPL